MNKGLQQIILLAFDERGITMRTVVIDEAQRIITVSVPSSITNKTSDRDQRALQRAIREKRIVVTIAPERARTIYATIQLPTQGDESTPIDEAALERMVTASIWKLFETERSRIAEALGIPEGETIVADAHIWEITMNGQSVMNPLTLESGEMVMTLSATLMHEAMWKKIQQAFGDVFVFVVESGISIARSISKTNVGNMLIAVGDERRTKLYSKEGDRLGYRDGFPWGMERLEAEVRQHCGVNAEIARHVIGAYSRGEGFPLFRETMERAMHGEVQLLVRGIEHALPKNKNFAQHKAAYLVAPWLLPGVPKFIQQFSSARASEELGFRIEWKCGQSDSAFGEIMPVIDAYIAPQQHGGNAIAKRYLRWRERS